MKYLSLIKSRAMREYVSKNYDMLNAVNICAIVALNRETSLVKRLDCYKAVFDEKYDNVLNYLYKAVNMYVSECWKSLEDFLRDYDDGEYIVNCAVFKSLESDDDYEEEWHDIIPEKTVFNSYQSAVTAVLDKAENIVMPEELYHFEVIKKSSEKKLAVLFNLNGEITDIGVHEDYFNSFDLFYSSGYEICVPFKKGDIIIIGNAELGVFQNMKNCYAKITTVSFEEWDYMQIRNYYVEVSYIEYPVEKISHKYKHIFEKLSEDVKKGKFDDRIYEEDFFEEFEEEE